MAVALVTACTSNQASPLKSPAMEEHGSQHPGVEIGVVASGETVRFDFRTCDGSENVFLYSLRVVEINDGSIEEVCRVRQSPVRDRPLSSWTYGEKASGFEEAGCEPLSTGKRYRVSVHADSVASTEFRILAGSSVEILGRRQCP